MTERAPSGAGEAGKRLWRAIMDVYDLAEHERAMLVEAVRTVDLCAQLQAAVAADGGPLHRDERGLRAHPAVVELRQQRIVLARLLVALRVPLGEEQADQAPRTQRRGTRGVYGIGAA